MSESENNYELMVIIDLGIGQAAVEKRLESIRKQLSKHGKIFFEDLWGERVLAYPMNKLEKGYYAVMDFSFDSAELKEFETGLRLEPEVVRHLIVKLPLKYEPKTIEELQEAHQDVEEEAVKEKETAKPLSAN